MNKQCFNPNRLLMSSSYIYITNIIIPNIDISTCTNPPKTCSFRHDALPASHLFCCCLVVATCHNRRGERNPKTHHGWTPRPPRPLAIKCWNDSGRLVLSQKSQCLKGVGCCQRCQRSINVWESPKKNTGWNGEVKERFGIICIWHHLWLFLLDLRGVWLYLWNMVDYMMTIKYWNHGNHARLCRAMFHVISFWAKQVPNGNPDFQ